MEMITMLARIFLLPLLATVGTFVHAKDFSVNLTEPDRYVLRAVTITRVDNKQITGVLSITGYEVATKIFVLDTAQQGELRVPAAEIKQLVFAQSVREAQPQAQICPMDVRVRRGSTTILKMPGNSLRVEQGKLTLNDADVPVSLGSGAILEAQRIDYDSEKDVFTASLLEVTYKIEPHDCSRKGNEGNSPGMSKGFQ